MSFDNLALPKPRCEHCGKILQGASATSRSRHRQATGCGSNDKPGNKVRLQLGTITKKAYAAAEHFHKPMQPPKSRKPQYLKRKKRPRNPQQSQELELWESEPLPKRIRTDTLVQYVKTKDGNMVDPVPGDTRSIEEVKLGTMIAVHKCAMGEPISSLSEYTLCDKDKYSVSTQRRRIV